MYLCWRGKAHIFTLATLLGCVLLELSIFILVSLPWDSWWHFKHCSCHYICPSPRWQILPLWSVITGKEMGFDVFLYQSKSLPFRNIISAIKSESFKLGLIKKQACHHLSSNELYMKTLRFSKSLNIIDLEFFLTLKSTDPKKTLDHVKYFSSELSWETCLL